MSIHALRTVRGNAATIFGLCAILLSACDDATGPTAGRLEVVVVTLGFVSDMDPDGYSIIVDGGPSRAIDATDELTIRGLSPGTHIVQLDGTAPNCKVNGTNPQPVDIPATETRYTRSVFFSVSCTPSTGAVRITTVTSGPDPDQNGYGVFVPAVGFVQLPTNGTRTVSGVKSGELLLRLENVSGNCSAAAPQPVAVMVQHAAIAEVEIRIECVQAGGLLIKTTTTGISLDANGYVLTARISTGDFRSDIVLPANGTAEITSLRPGDYLLIVSDIVPNCDPVVPGNRTIEVGAGTPTAVTIEVVCAAPRRLAFVYGAGNSGRLHSILTDGRPTGPLTVRVGIESDPAWSPDGNSIAFTSLNDGNADIYLLNGVADAVRLTSHAARDYRPAWSPDAKRIAFVSERDGNPEIYVMNADGSEQVRVTNSPGLDSDPDWSPDGTRIAFTRDHVAGRAIFTMNPDGSGLVQVTSNSVGDKQPAWSPDGLRIVFARFLTQSGADIFDMNADGSDVRRLTQNLEGASDPAWSPDGRQIAFSAVSCVGYSFYYDYCDPHILVLKPDGALFVLTTTQFPAFNPAWRPGG